MSKKRVRVGRMRFVRADLLLPGDVFLSRSVGKESSLIAMATFGPFSHAAIYHGNNCVFESIDDGVGYTGLKIAKACTRPGKGPVTLLDVSEYRQLEIRRHPRLAHICREDDGRRDTEDRLSELLIARNGFEYPAWTALARAVPFLPVLVVYPIMWAVAYCQGDLKKIAPGMFCSQLVAAALEDLDACPLKSGILGGELPPERISPNRFQSYRSVLIPVQDAIVDETFDCKDPNSNQWFVDQLRAQQEQFLLMVNKERTIETRKELLHVDDVYKRIKELTDRVKAIRE